MQIFNTINSFPTNSSRFLLSSSSVCSFIVIKSFGTVAKRSKLSVDPRILDMFKNESVMDPVAIGKPLTNYLVATNETSLTLFPRTETRLRSHREHHLNTIMKAIFTAGYYDVDFSKVLRILRVVAIEFMTENDANEDPIPFTINTNSIIFYPRQN